MPFFQSLGDDAGVRHIVSLNPAAGGALIEFHADVDSAPVQEKLRPLLRYARKLTLEPAHMKQADADAVFAAGWDEAELHDAVLTICLFNFMNRLLEGHGVKGNAELYASRGQALREQGYAPLLAAIAPAKP